MNYADDTARTPSCYAEHPSFRQIKMSSLFLPNNNLSVFIIPDFLLTIGCFAISGAGSNGR
jgi:hypothetical protein